MFVSVAGRPIYCRETEATVATEVPPLLLVHGAYDNHALWDGLTREFEGACRILAIDLPGHGESPGPAFVDQSGYAGLLHALTQALNLRAFTLCGHSMGGSMALAFALSHPEAQARLILLGSAPSWSIAPRDIDLWDEDPDRAFRENLDFLFSPATPEPVRASYDRHLRQTSAATCKADLEACRSFALDGHLGEIQAPSLVVCGRDEFWRDGSQLLASSLPNAHSAIVEDAGHAIAWEKPAELAASIRAFVLADNRGAQPW